MGKILIPAKSGFIIKLTMKIIPMQMPKNIGINPKKMKAALVLPRFSIFSSTL